MARRRLKTVVKSLRGILSELQEEERYTTLELKNGANTQKLSDLLKKRQEDLQTCVDLISDITDLLSKHS